MKRKGSDGIQVEVKGNLINVKPEDLFDKDVSPHVREALNKLNPHKKHAVQIKKI